ncbi:hypothetical protein [Streptomyces sp. DASNCL29]|uniref:hypothetical protein n=1 Tax=Streptomyces sp. DASNCL29 TaxID=2583819 RepID=UPI0019D1F411|nr:hypothetical protein [Streptomyces sp. DASNCL29]
MEAPSQAATFLEGEARALLTRLDRVKPFALHETMVPAAALAPAAQAAVESFLIRGRKNVRTQVEAYLSWLTGPGRDAMPELLQRRFALLRQRFNEVLTQFDLFQEAITQRSEREIGVWLSGLDVAAADALAVPGTVLATPIPVACYLDRGPGGAIRRANTLIAGGRSPIALIRIPRERMVGYGIGATLVHEVGHQAAALLGLVGSLRSVLYDLERRSRHPAERAAFAYWGLTVSEIVPDLYAVGKLGIAATLGLMAVVSLPRRLVLTPVPGDRHPFPYIRVRLSCAMGEALCPHPQWRKVSDLWTSLYPPSRTPDELHGLIRALEASIPRFVSLLLRHRSTALRGAQLSDLMPRFTRTPELLAARYRSWSRQPSLMRAAPPTLVFAVLGQARAAALITPEEESRLLGDLITHWALSSTLDAMTRCAGGASEPLQASNRGGQSWRRSGLSPNPSSREAGFSSS